MQITQAIDYFLIAKKAERVSPNTVTYYSEVLYRMARTMPAIETTDDINRFTMLDYISRMQDDPKLKPVSVHKNLRGLRVFCTWLRGEGLTTSNPFDKLETPNYIKVGQPPETNMDILSDTDFRALLKTCDRSTDKGRRDEAILMFLFDTGVRVGELVTLTVDNLDMKSRQARIIGKGRKWRTVFFSPQTAVAIARYRARKDESEFVFCGWGTRGIKTTTAVNHMIAQRARRAGVKARCNPHTFRHTFATNFLRLGGSPANLQRILGHGDISTTIRNYAHLVTDDLAKAHEQYSPLSRALGGR